MFFDQHKSTKIFFHKVEYLKCQKTLKKYQYMLKIILDELI